MDELVLIDGNSLLNRAFYALPLLTNSNGKYCNALYGFTNIIIKLITEQKPKYMAVAFDLKHPTFRHEKFEGYKGKRKPTPPELVEQIESMKEILKIMGIKILQQPGFEADDLIGTMSKKFNIKTIVVSGDKDLFQLIDKNVEVWHTKKGISDIIKLNEEKLKEFMGVTPLQIIDLKSLMGDASDNIPGVEGIGPKTATDLLTNYSTLNNIYCHLDELKKSVQEKLVKNKETAYLSKWLATIKTDVPLDVNLQDCLIQFPFNQDVLNVFKEYEFKSIIKRDNLFLENVKTENVKTVEHKIIDTMSQLNLLCDEINKVTEFSIVISNNIHIALSKYQEYEIVSQQSLLDSGLNINESLKQLKQCLENNKIKKICYNAKELMRILSKFNITLQGLEFDCNLANYLVSGSKKSDLSLDDFVLEFNYEKQAYASCLLFAYSNLKQKLQEFEMENLYYNIELPLVSVLFNMEQNGFKIDVKELDNLIQENEQKLNMLTNEIYECAGEKFNINSPKQLADILFNKLNLPSPKKQSTSVDVLEKLSHLHNIVPLILSYRKIFKIQSTYLEGFKKVVEKDTNLIHTVFHQTLTATGRLSSTEPNLQNIPIRDEEGKKLRKLFISRFENGYIISADYSQIELRILAHYSNDENLIMAYKNGLDIHAKTASDVFGVPINQVTEKMRREAKAVNFGIIYGMSNFGLSENLGISNKQAKEYINTYFEKYGKVKQFMDNAVLKAKETGYATTLFNRRRNVLEITSSNFVTRQFGERIAMNMPFQGTAADIIKLAMVNVYNRLKKENLKSKLILQIHDELIIDATKEEKEIVESILKEEMENVVTLKVPLVVNVESGHNWYDAK